jgi:type I restriction enzyme S subunit
MNNALGSIRRMVSAEIPAGWHKTTLGQIGEYINGRGFKKTEWSDFGLPIIRIQDLTGTGKEQNYFNGDIDERHIVNPGDLLISWSATLGAYIWQGPKAALNQHIFKVRSYIDKKCHYYLIQHILGDLYRQAHGSGMVHITKTKFENTPVFLPETEEGQRQLVAEIEKQFSRLDEAVANLKRVKANLKRYKAALLKAAVEGKLTEEWRKAHPDVEPASKLLDRILAERRAKWEEAELTKMEAKGKAPKNNKWKAKYKDPLAPAHEESSDLPQGWAWSRTDQLFWFVTSGSRGWAKYYTNSGPIFLRVGNLDHDSIELDLQDLQHVQPPEGAEGTRTKVTPGDVLVSITADVGMIAVVPKGLGNAYINQHISLARPVDVSGCEYVAWYLAARPGQKQFQDLQRGATKAGLGLDDIKGVDVPLPPLEEQQQIVQEIEGRLSLVDDLDLQVDANIRRATRLRQALLTKAFGGGLVPETQTIIESDALGGKCHG